MLKLVFFVGVAGTGKTTVARKLAGRMPAAFLDRDTVGGRFVEKILEMNGLDVNDRDSEFYKKHCVTWSTIRRATSASRIWRPAKTSL
ncbi:hypothetical protein HMSSN139_60160 [Paenibacillus sp. HMSSN-139]|nr:hypothetical protein HMSSN139_60160 [Paenibacillus sp. HMSSN-139]